MAVTSKDIAARLGISQPTVSRVLNGDIHYKVSTTTRQLIFATAEEMGYSANALARALRNKRTDVIGLYTLPHVLDTRQEFFGYLYGGLQRSCETHRVDILVHKTFEGRLASEVYAEIIDGRTDGVVVYLNNPDVPLVARLQQTNLPVVSVADPLPGIPAVACEDLSGMTRMMEYLWDKGHRRFAFIAPQHRATAVLRRYDAFRAFLEERGAEPDERVLVYVEGDQTEQALDFIWRFPKRPTAVCCWNDRTAYDLLRHCLDREIKIPDDLAVTGFDGFGDAQLPIFQLVSVKVPWYEMAQTAVDLLIQRINGAEIPMETLLPVELMLGTTA